MVTMQGALYLRMPQYRVGNVGCLEVGAFFRRQLDVSGGDEFFELGKFGSTNDGGGDPGLMEQPGEGNLGGQDAAQFR